MLPGSNALHQSTLQTHKCMSDFTTIAALLQSKTAEGTAINIIHIRDFPWPTDSVNHIYIKQLSWAT